MAALASTLIRQKRETREAVVIRPLPAQRKVCPRGTKSLCQKHLLLLVSKVRLCGGARRAAGQDPREHRAPSIFLPNLVIKGKEAHFLEIRKYQNT